MFLQRGLCGVLASVQAFILKTLLFDSDAATVCLQPFCPTTHEVNTSLVYALSDILWQAGQKQCGVIARYVIFSIYIICNSNLTGRNHVMLIVA